MISMLFLCLSSSLNPAIYIWRMNDIRIGLKNLLRKLFFTKLTVTLHKIHVSVEQASHWDIKKNKKTKQKQRKCKFNWMKSLCFGCPTCSLAWRILDHVAIRCKGPIMGEFLSTGRAYPLGNQGDMLKTLGEISPKNLRNLHRSRICFVTS